MDDFPEFMRCSANRIAANSQATPGVEGYVFDGADGSQMAFWTCHQTAVSAEHAHEYDEYIIVAQGCYTLLIGGRRTPIEAGQEYFIPSITRSALSRQTSPRTSSEVFSLQLEESFSSSRPRFVP